MRGKENPFVVESVNQEKVGIPLAAVSVPSLGKEGLLKSGIFCFKRREYPYRVGFCMRSYYLLISWKRRVRRDKSSMRT